MQRNASGKRSCGAGLDVVDFLLRVAVSSIRQFYPRSTNTCEIFLNPARKDRTQCASYLTARRRSALPQSLRAINDADSASVLLRSTPPRLRPAAERLISFQRACSLRAPPLSLRKARPLSSETLCSCLPGGLALISIPQLSGSFSSSKDKSARPPPKSSANISPKFSRTCAKVSENNFLVVELICAITSSNLRREAVRSLFWFSRKR